MPEPRQKRSLNYEVNDLLVELLSRYNPDYGLGHMSPSIYDTAWVSMVSKENEWVFPAAFQCILNSQFPSGGWESLSTIDSILNTLSALLSLSYHSKNDEFSKRIHTAKISLSALLRSWDVPSTERVGFEITIPTILALLSKQGIDFAFPHRTLLMDLNRKKLAKMKPEMIYQHRTTALHSLEGFIGHLDFNKLAHHKRHGNFMASPSSTAAYLMHTSVWDNDCEAYLREVLSQCECFREGSVPSAWPTTYFELSWIVCNIRDGGFNFNQINQGVLAKISHLLKTGIDAGHGIVGFALEVEADADDSAKVVTALHYLGVPTPVGPLCDAFELDSHFQCYSYERNASITVQCNVLSALLVAVESSSTGTRGDMQGIKARCLAASVQKAVAFISKTWWTTNENLVDKWHDSIYYVYLLISQSLTKFMLLFNKGHFPDVPEIFMQTKIPVALFQILVRLLQAQRGDGSWGSTEETAYALLSLKPLASLPFVSIMRDTIQDALDRGRMFLLDNPCHTQDTTDRTCLWIDKINYRIPHVSYSYVLAALHATSRRLPKPDSTVGEVACLIFIPTKRIRGFLQFYRKMPLFRDCQDWQLLAYIAEGYLYLPLLRDIATPVSGREGMDEDKYTEYILMGWTSANVGQKKCTSLQNCFAMMTISIFIFQVDEFFDSMVRDEGTPALPVLRQALNDMFTKLNDGQDITSINFADGPYSNLVRCMHKYISFIINYPTTQNASHYDKTHLQRELKAFLHAMIQQAEDNTVYAAQSSWETFKNPASSYLKWVRTIGSEHLTGPFA